MGYTINKKNSPKIVYKPIFYRTQDLQSINIRKNIVQNIGINLDEYMTKVETFKLLVDDKEYIEYGRNNIFVIFNINGVGLESKSGKYIITNEKYIGDSRWQKYYTTDSLPTKIKINQPLKKKLFHL